MASSNIFYLSLLIVVVLAAASSMAFVLDFPSVEPIFKSFCPRFLLIWSALVQRLNIFIAITACFAGYLLKKLCQFLFSPLEIIRTLEDVGFSKNIEGTGFTKKNLVNTLRRLRKAGAVPPVYPNGWFRVLDSDQLKVGEVKYVCVLGENLAVFRGEDGISHILDAYCPHLGANIGVGGQVTGSCIQCPFHGWTFRGDDGKCTNIPYASKVPDNAKTRSWPCVEKNGTIYIWYHAEGVDPTWVIEDVDEIANKTWTYRGRTEHLVNAHCEEIPENGADLNHLNFLHGPPIIFGKNLEKIFSKFWKFGKHEWFATWEEGDEKHIGEITLKHEAKLFGVRLPIADFYVKAKQMGPGIVYLWFDSLMGSGVLIQSVTPVEPLLQKLTHQVYTGITIPVFVAKIILYIEATQVERDIMVWNNKTFANKPILVKEDHLISKHRRWFSQFYSENSPRLNLKKESAADW